MKKQIKDNSARPRWGLFEESFWKHPIKWLKDLKIYRERIRHVKKYGYSPQAEWETFNWFIDSMREILKHYRYNRNGTGYILDVDLAEGSWDGLWWEKNENFFNTELDKMLELLDKMDERNYTYPEKEDWDKMREASEEFFKMFAKYFYSFWD